MTDTKLLPCPFCGSDSSLEYAGGDDMDYLTRVEASCDSCYAELTVFVPHGETISKEAGERAVSDAVRQWNTRAYESELQQLRAENERLKEVLETARLGLEAMVEQDRCGENFLATVLTIENINLAIGSRGES